MEQEIAFYSDGLKLHGDLSVPEGLAPGERRSAVVLVQGFATAKSGPMYALARELGEWGYVVLNFDFRGFGDSEGERCRMLPLEQVEDTRAAVAFLRRHPSVDPERVGLYGASFGGGLAVYAAALDPRVPCVATAVTVGNGATWMRSLRRAWEWREFLTMLREDALNRAATGQTRWVPRGEVLLYEPEVAARMAEAARSGQASVSSARCNELSLLTAQAVVDFAPELVASRITTQPVLFLVAENDARVPNEVSRELYDSVAGPKRWVVVPDAGHDAVYNPPAWDIHLAEVRNWLSQYLPARVAS